MLFYFEFGPEAKSLNLSILGLVVILSGTFCAILV